MLTVKADSIPYPWFDEGWTLTTARNWVEHGKYALHLGDEWVSAETMTQSFTVTTPIAISFKLFGVGLVSGRLPNILYTIGMLAWLFAITAELYDHRVAWGTLVVAFLLPPSLELQPFILGRQALGEIPMIFFLLGGYWFLYQTLKQPRKLLFFICASLFWGLAIITKSQPVPFWLASLLLPLLLALKNKDYQALKIFGLLIPGTIIFSTLFSLINNSLLASAPLYGPPVSPDYLKLLVWNPDSVIRLNAVMGFISVGIFPVIGMVHIFKKNWAVFKSETRFSPHAWLELSLLVLTFSWTIWYLIGSWGWYRYYLPAYIICWSFFTKAIYDWTTGFDLKTIIKRLSTVTPKSWKTIISHMGGIAILVISFLMAWLNTSWFISTIPNITNRSIYTLAEYIQTNTTPTALIETYEGELLFILSDHRIHFPAHEIEEELNRRTFLKEDIAITYDPLAANPDILIVGNFARLWHLYDPLLEGIEFKLITKIGRYDIYQRVR
jgi:hypothetical protein